MARVVLAHTHCCWPPQPTSGAQASRGSHSSISAHVIKMFEILLQHWQVIRHSAGDNQMPFAHSRTCGVPTIRAWSFVVEIYH